MNRYEERIARLRVLMKTKAADAFVLTSPASIRYFTGFKTHEDCAVVYIPFRSGKVIIVSDPRYKTQIEEEVDPNFFKILMVRLDLQQSYLAKLKEEISRKRPRRLHIEAEHMRAGQYLELKHLWPHAQIVASSDSPLKVRSVKDGGEIILIKKAAEITETALASALLSIKDGIRENDLAAEISYKQKKLGASGDAFPLIVLSGARTALVHGNPAAREIRRGEIIQFDIGCVYEGYHSDLSRIVFFGSPDPKLLEVSHFVRQIQETMIAKIKPGVCFRDLNLEYERLLKEAGFEAQHSLGHGVGLEIHELPTLRMGEFFAPGQVVTIEPGIYISGKGGARIEDMVLVTENGREVLTSFSKEMCVL